MRRLISRLALLRPRPGRVPLLALAVSPWTTRAMLVPAFVFVVGSPDEARAQARPPKASLAIAGVTLFPSPEAPPIEDAVILVGEGAVIAADPREYAPVPEGVEVLDCAGCSALAGFWNVHVHFTEEGWAGADTAAAERLAALVRDMLTSRGFVHVLDTGSYLENTLALRRRIERGDVPGPSIRTTGPGFVAPGGSPFYIAPARLPELSRASEAAVAVRERLDAGADAIKLFTASLADPDRPVAMAADVAAAAVQAAHERGRRVVAHPTNNAGLRVALAGGVDLLAHTTPDGGEPWDDDLVREMVSAGLAVAPTLHLWRFELERRDVPAERVERFLRVALDQVGAFVRGGGTLLFGTDVGYVTDHDPTNEYLLLDRAGLSFPGILAALTTAPAEFFGVGGQRGRLEPGFSADLVLVEGRPDRDLRALTRVRYAIRDGDIVFAEAP